jgi:hypothetical protein
MPTRQPDAGQRTDHGVHKAARRAKTVRSGHIAAGYSLGQPFPALSPEASTPRDEPGTHTCLRPGTISRLQRA